MKMTKQEVLELIARYIISNGDGAITATVLQPILEQMVLQPNILIGRLELLNTIEKDSLVNAINSIVTMDISELVDTVNMLVENDIAQDEKIISIQIESERLEIEKADKTEIPDVSNLVTQIQFTDGLDLKADLSYVNEELDMKANISDIPDISGLSTKIELTEGLDLKANQEDFLNLESTVNTKIDEAPEDGKTYGRKDAIWQEVVVDVSNLATKTELSDGLDLKSDLTYVDEELGKKADISAIPDTSGLATKIELTDGLDLKANKLDVDADLLQINTEIGQVETALSSKIGDAPSDGKQYARQNETWSEVVSGGGSGSLVKVDLEDGTVAYKLDSNDLIPTTSSIDLRAGNQTEQLGAYAVSISADLPGGYENTASGGASIVLGGYQNTASGNYTTVLAGIQNTASGDYTTVLAGRGNTASGVDSIVLGGGNNTASGSASAVLGGGENTASGGRSAVLAGRGNTATNFSETVVGMYSDNTGTPETNRVAGSPIFRVGIGKDINERKDGLIVTNEGNLKLPEADTGIELTSPNGTAYKLTVSDAGELVITAV